MAILLDTDSIDPGLTVEAVTEVVRRHAAPQHVMSERPAVRARFDVWDLGGVALYRARSSGLRLVRTAKQVRSAPSPIVSITLGRAATTRHQFGTEQDLIPRGQLFAVDLDTPYEIGWSGSGGQTALFVPVDQLALPVEMIRAAIPQVWASPLCPLVSGHISTLAESADALEADPAVGGIGSASVELVRALLTSAIGAGSGDGGAVPAAILLTRIREYVRGRLADPELNPELIARAHNVSVRYLYKLCAGADFSLEQWIIGERLERVRADLVRSEYEHRSIAAIARGWGFQDPSHFARRFRAAFGVTPREWRRSAH